MQKPTPVIVTLGVLQSQCSAFLADSSARILRTGSTSRQERVDDDSGRRRAPPVVAVTREERVPYRIVGSYGPRSPAPPYDRSHAPCRSVPPSHPSRAGAHGHRLRGGAVRVRPIIVGTEGQPPRLTPSSSDG